MKKTKKRNPTDLTLRNLRALKKRVKELELSQHNTQTFLHYITDNFLPSPSMSVFEEIIKGKR